MLVLIGPNEGDVCRCDAGGQHERLLTARGWQSLAELDPRQIRAFAPEGLKLAPNAKPETLAESVSAAVLAGGSLSPKGWVSNGTGPGGAPAPDPPPDPPAEEIPQAIRDMSRSVPRSPDPLECPVCGRGFASVGGRKSHQTRVHG